MFGRARFRTLNRAWAQPLSRRLETFLRWVGYRCCRQRRLRLGRAA